MITSGSKRATSGPSPFGDDKASRIDIQISQTPPPRALRRRDASCKRQSPHGGQTHSQRPQCRPRQDTVPIVVSVLLSGRTGGTGDGSPLCLRAVLQVHDGCKAISCAQGMRWDRFGVRATMPRSIANFDGGFADSVVRTPAKPNTMDLLAEPSTKRTVIRYTRSMAMSTRYALPGILESPAGRPG
jgi:hypothetical protein